MSNHAPNHHFIKYLLTAGILVLLGFLLFDYKKELLLILDISAFQFTLISILILTSIFLNGSKLNKITKNFNVYLSIKEWFALSSMTTLFNNFIYKSGSIVTSKYLKSRHNFPYSAFAAAFVCDQLILLFIALIIASIIFFYLGIFIKELICLILILIATVSILFFLYRLKKPLPSSLNPIFSQLKNVIQNFNLLLTNKNLLFSLIVHNVLLVLTIVFRISISSSILHLDIPLSSCFLFTAIIMFTRIIPITVNDMGLRELTVGFLSSILGSGLKAGVLITSIDRVFDLIWGALFTVSSQSALTDKKK
tara:strand:+ start:536 stop:1459 length:924 start_codon:yes stop_codon:yes gene_type:complete